jgi:hypothetical protein
MAQHIGAATSIGSVAGVYSLSAGPGSIGFFKSSGGSGNWSLEDLNGTPPSVTPPHVAVNGHVVWLFPRGVRFDQPVTVTGLPTSALIIVAGRNTLTSGDDQSKGIAFKSSIISNTVPVILVSDGTVSIENKVITTSDTRASFLSVYARDAYLLGPHNFGGPSNRMSLTYPSGPVMEVLLDLLYTLGILPNMSVGGSVTLPPVAGSWRDLTESNPS